MDGSRLAQPYEAMFERNVAHVAKTGREVEVWVEGLVQPKVGFVAGLDQEFLQVCITATGNLSSIRRDSVVSMDETGLRIGALITESKGTDAEDRVRRIRDSINHFQKRATAVLAGS